MSLDFPDTTVNNPDTGAPWAQGDTVAIDDITYVFNTDAGPPVTFWWSAATPGGTEGLWQRNGTTLTPFTNNDTVAVTQADGTQNIQLLPTGSAVFADLVRISSTTDGDDSNAFQTFNSTGTLRTSIGGSGTFVIRNAANSANNIALNQDGRAEFEGSIRNPTLRSISDAGAWDLNTGNLWRTDVNAGSNTIANPTNATAGMSGLIFTQQEITTWGNNFDFSGGAAPATVPANSVIPFWVLGDNQILIGNATENVS